MSAPRERWTAGFRTKLTVAIMLIVCGVTALALFVAGRSGEADVQAQLQREFQREFAARFAVQETRRAAVAGRCRALANAVRIRAALEENDVKDLYANGAVELRDVLAGETDPHAEFFRFLDARGAALSPPAVAAEAWESQLAMTAVPDTQQVGYITAQSADGTEALREVIATRIVDTQTGEVIGALVLGFEAGAFGGRLGGPESKTGTWSQGRLRMPALAEADRAALGSAVAKAVGADAGGRGFLRVTADGAPHLLFYEVLNPKSRFPAAYQLGLYPLAGALAHKRAMRWQILGAGAALLLAGLGASHLVSTRLAAPVERLAEDSAAEHTHRVRAEAALEQTHDTLRTRNAELQHAMAELTVAQQHIVQQERLRALGQMASGIAHDFNNALVPILGFCELLILSPAVMADRKKALSYLETIQTAAKDAASVVSRLREFYRPDKGDRAFAPVHLKRLVEQAITLTQPKWKDQAQANGATVEVVLDLEAVPPVAGEESALREVLTNLIFNAVDAMPAGGTLTLRTRRAGDTAVLEVGDTGTGMSETVRQRCLEPFFSTKGERGTGLGLSMVFGIVQRHSGALDLRSAIGQGTTFIITLPLQDAAPVRTAAAPDRPAQRPLRVLVVDDEAPVRDTLAAVLAADGHAVTLAENGADGLRSFGAGEFDLVITDKAMPVMNGDQMAAAIKRGSPGTPIILLTGFGLFHEKAEFPDVDVLASKPIRIPALRDAIATATQPA